MSSVTIESLLEGRRSQPDQLIEVLHDVQARFGYIPENAMQTISQELGIPLMEVYRVAGFYKAFSLTPRGKNVISICMGTACHVREAKLLLNQILGQLGISSGETTEDRQFTVEHVNCLGACALGPIVVHNGKYHHHVTPSKLRKIIDSVCESSKEETAYAQDQ